MTECAFFMELSEIITGQNLKKAVCSLAVGKPPVQFLSPGELEAGIEKNLDLGEDFYGDAEFNDDELDNAGDTEGVDEESMEAPYDERY